MRLMICSRPASAPPGLASIQQRLDAALDRDLGDALAHGARADHCNRIVGRIDRLHVASPGISQICVSIPRG